MSSKLIDQIEAFLASGGEPSNDVSRISIDGKPVYGVFTADEMRAAYGDVFMDNFFRQTNEYLKGNADGA